MKTPLSFALPPIIGHRGLAGLAPENTMPAFTAAHQHKLRFVELDAKLTHDKQVVVLHDNNIKRTSNGQGRAADLSLAELQKMDFGSWFDPAFQGTRIALLDEVLAFCATHQIGVNIELKPNPNQYALTAQRVADCIAAGRWADRLPLLLSSFSIQSLRAIKHYAPHLPRALLWEKSWDETRCLHLLEELNAVAFNPSAKAVTDALSHTIKNAGYHLVVWTVNDIHDALRLYSMGVDAVFSDQPLKLPH